MVAWDSRTVTLGTSLRPNRNEPCHCGSHQKYKRCCQNLDERAARKDRKAELPPWVIDSRRKLNLFLKYTTNVYGVCKKYADCDCSLFESMDACTAEFGKAQDLFPPEVWSCVLTRSCETLCTFNAGTCYTLYAEELAAGLRTVGEGMDCPEGTKPMDVYDLHGEFVRSECK